MATMDITDTRLDVRELVSCLVPWITLNKIIVTMITDYREKNGELDGNF